MKPILFNGEMVRAIKDGRKTQTRRVVKPRYVEDYEGDGEPGDICYYLNGFSKLRDRGNALGELSAVPYAPPYGQPWGRLYVREAFGVLDAEGLEIQESGELESSAGEIWYRADHESGFHPRWRPSIHMPKWAARLFLETTAVRVEQLQDISEEDAMAEGVYSVCESMSPFKVETRYVAPGVVMENMYGEKSTHAPAHSSAIAAFECLWNSITKPGEQWDDNPWVWVNSFTPIDGAKEQK